MDADPLKTFNVLLKTDDFVAIDKPRGFHVHQPEFPHRRVPRDLTCLAVLRAQLDTWLYPVHRIDVATEGVLVFALNKATAAHLCRQFEKGSIRKTYFAIVRGWTDDSGCIELPLELDSTGVPVDALTEYRTHARVELPSAVGKRHATARYSLVEARPETGRFHQIRRHFARLSHPVIGDRSHGDSSHNVFFRHQLECPGLWLKAKAIEFTDPATDQRVHIETSWGSRWEAMFAKFGWLTPHQEVPRDHERTL